MMFLLDTNVVSELIKSSPDNNVLEWFEAVPEEHLRLSVLSLGEIQSGIEYLPEGKKRNNLILWFDQLLESFKYQLLPVDSKTALKWGELSGYSRKNGKKLSIIDGLIASTAYLSGAILVTRNTRDFEGIPIQVLNPWLA